MSDYKVCSKCKNIKSINDFSKDKQRKDGLYPHCKLCQKTKIEKWIEKNKTRISQYHKKYYQLNRDKVKNYQHKNKKQRMEYMKLWREKNKIRLREYKRNYHNNVESKILEKRIVHNLRSRIQQALKGEFKTDHTMELVGCDMISLKSYIESKFTDGMSWENYGRKGWHIDHIKPCSSFDMTKIEEQKLCFHYTNLQPLWWLDNCRKNKY